MSVYPLSAGAPDMSGTAIPEIWVPEWQVKFYETTVFGQIASTDLVKGIKNQGDTAHIRVYPTFDVKKYYKGMKMVGTYSKPTIVDFVVDQGFYIDEAVDNVDAIQSDINLMNAWNLVSTETMKVKVDSTILAGIVTQAAAANQGATAGAKSGSYDLGATGAAIPITEDNATKKLVHLTATLQEQNVPVDGCSIVVPYWYGAKLVLSDLVPANEMGDATSVLRSGYIGKINGYQVLQSNNMTAVTDGTDSTTCWHCLCVHKSAIAFASQLETLRVVEPTDELSKHVQLVNIFGYKVVNPNHMSMLYCRPAA